MNIFDVDKPIPIKFAESIYGSLFIPHTKNNYFGFKAKPAIQYYPAVLGRLH